MFTGEQAVEWVRRSAAVVEENSAALTRLDAAIGDGDHGTNMTRGFRAVLARLEGLADKDFSSLFRAVSMALIGKVGGAAGPLYGSFYLGMGKQLGSADEAADADLSAALRAGYDGVVARGKAQVGDKTMLDALDDRPQGTRQLPRRALPGPPGPRRHLQPPHRPGPRRRRERPLALSSPRPPRR